MENYQDLRKISKGELLRLRKQVVRLKQKGYSGAEIESELGIRQNRISEIWNAYLKEGANGLKSGVQGRKQGEKTLLPSHIDKEVRQILLADTPDHLDMPYSLWTRNIVSDFIHHKYGIRLSLRCMTNYFKKWGFVCKAPAGAAKVGTAAAIAGANARSGAAAIAGTDTDFVRFMSDVYPGIVRRAGSENVGIYWYSETIVSREYPKTGTFSEGVPGNGAADSNATGSGAPRGKNVRMAATSTARGTVRFMFFEGHMTQEKFITLVSRLIRYADRKVFLIAEDRKPCRGEKVSAWLKGREDRIEVFYHPRKDEL